MKSLLVLAILMIHVVASALVQKDILDCTETEEYFHLNCPVSKGDYNGCCLCSQKYYYSCDCCQEVVNEIGVMGDCSKWGEPTGHDNFCFSKRSIKEGLNIIVDYNQ